MVDPHPPLWSPRWNMNGLVLEYKPYPSYPNWLPAWDITEVMLNLLSLVEASVASETARATAAEEALQAAIDQLQLDLSATDAVANQGVIDAAYALGRADTANTAVEDLEVRVTALEA